MAYFRAVLVILISLACIQTSYSGELKWRDWNDTAFRDAKAQKKYVILDLEAVWCHWCHFMEERTYSHPEVIKYLKQGYITVRADQDAHPDLASRYGDWGWPATIIFDGDGNEVAKFRGFIRPSLMIAYLSTILNNPEKVPPVYKTPQVTKPASVFLNDLQRKTITDLQDSTYDEEHGAWGKRLKFLHPDSLNYALEQARRGDATAITRVKASLDAGLNLMDTEWGGVYQYSHERDWSAPHYEKIMWYQYNNMRIYAQGYALFGDPKYLKASQEIYHYLITRLRSPEGAFYTSQDADVDNKMLGKEFYSLKSKERNKLGKQPKVDKNLYARENGWAISGLLSLYSVTGDIKILQHATIAADWIIKNRSLTGGGFSHGAKDKAGPFIADTLSMGLALIKLYETTGDRKWLIASAKALDFINDNFRSKAIGFITAKTTSTTKGIFKKPFINIEENIQLAHLANLIHRYHGKKKYREMAEYAMRYLTAEKIVNQRRFLVGIIMADDNLALEPAHITIVGKKDDPAAKALHKAALKLAIDYKRVDFWDTREGPMINPDVTYPELDKAAAFACANQVCSLPVFNPQGLDKAVKRMMGTRITKREVATKK
ncbi:MAG: DUF255 domain-containing protein [Methyloligellaceae bacterium]